MKITPKILSLIILLININVFLAIFIIQYFFELKPCNLCIWQRWPYIFAICVSLLILSLNFDKIERNVSKKLFQLLSFIYLSGSILAIYHFGIENLWWSGISGCPDQIVSTSVNLNDLRDKLLNTPITRCDVPQWELFNISLAGYNIVSSIILCILSLNFSKFVDSKI
ncbi:disulfide bond formation protein B [Alphaproteobacteria bacterium]|nr:disulfide bond formation protein B [Alphaproteobacteria bacterium]